MSKTVNHVILIRNGERLKFGSIDRVYLQLMGSPAAMLEKFRSQTWAFDDCFKVFLGSHPKGMGRGLDFYYEEMRKGGSLARLGILAGSILAATLVGLSEEDSVVDFDAIERGASHGD